MKIYAHYNIENENAIDGHYTDEIHGDNIPEPSIEITEEERHISCAHGGECFIIDGAFTFDPPPAYGNMYKRTNGAWVADIAAVKTAKASEISAAYLAERTTANKGITSEALGGAVIDCREKDIIDVSNLLAILEGEGITDHFYKLKDNSRKPCTTEQIREVLSELRKAILSMWTLNDSLVAQVNAATTAEEIQAIKWQWPASE